MNNGYIKMYRKTMNSFVWTHPQMFKLWTLCLMKASHKDNRFLFNGSEIGVSSGQFVTGGHAIAKEYNEGMTSDNQIVWRTLWRWLKRFENEGMLTIDSNTKYSVISIKNWHEYQVDDNQVSSARQSNDNQVSTNKNDKNDKNDKNKDITSSSQKSKTRIYEDNSEPYLLAEFLSQRIKENNPEAKKPNLQKWADDMRKTIELDKRSYDQVKNMIEWSQAHEFWSGVVLSAKGIRSKYDQMKVQANNDYKNKKTGNSFNKSSNRNESLPDWAKESNKTEIKDTPVSEEIKQEYAERLKKLRERKEKLNEHS